MACRTHSYTPCLVAILLDNDTVHNPFEHGEHFYLICVEDQWFYVCICNFLLLVFVPRVNLLTARRGLLNGRQNSRCFTLRKLQHAKSLRCVVPFHYEKQRHCVPLTGTFTRASEIWTFLYAVKCRMCFCILWFVWSTFLNVLNHFEMPGRYPSLWPRSTLFLKSWHQLRLQVAVAWLV
jgi:hypothetical protein